MLQKIKNNLALKISILFAIAQIIIMALFSAYMYARYRNALNTEHYELTARPAYLLNEGLSSVEIVNNKDVLEDIIGVPVHLALLVNDEGIVTHATESTWIGQPIAQIEELPSNARSLTEPEGFTIDDGCTIVVREINPSVAAPPATLYIEADDAHIQVRLLAVLGYASFGMVFVVLIYALFLWYIVKRTIREPIAGLVTLLQQAEQGDLSVRSPVKKINDDIGILQRRTNAMLSARERTHSDIEHLNRVLRAIRDINQIIAMQHDADSLIHAVTDHLTASGSYDCAWIALHNEEGTTRSLSMYPHRPGSPSVNHTTIGSPECIQHLLSSTEDVSQPLLNIPSCGDHNCIMKHFGEQVIVAKLSYNNTLYGVIAVSVPAEFTIDIQEKSLFHAVADDVAYGLFNIQNEKERALAIENMENTRHQWQRVVNTMPVMLDAFDEDRNIIAWNEQAERITGYSADEIINNPKAMELFYPDPVYRSQVMDSVRNPAGDFGLHHEWVLTNKNGEERIVDWYNGSQYTPLPMWAHWAVGIDITERVKAEQALRETDKHIESLLKNPVGYVVFRLKLNRSPFEAEVVLISPSVEEVTGVSPHNGDILTSWMRNIHPADITTLRKGYLTGMRPPYIFDVELRYLHPTKGQRWLHVRASGMESPKLGEIEYTNGILMDITERVETARALEESNQHIQSLLQNPVGYVMFRLKMGSTVETSKLVLISPSVGEIAGVNPCEQDSITTWLRFVHPEDMPVLMQKFAEALEPPYMFDLEVRYLHPQKGQLWMHIQANGVMDTSGRYLAYSNGIMMDVTERKNAEEQLHEFINRLRQAEIAAQSGFWSRDPQTGEEWWSENHYRLHGMDPKNHADPTYDLHMSVVHPDDRDVFDTLRWRDLEHNVDHTESEFRMLLPDGSVRHILARSQVERDAEGKAIRMLGMDQDITERKANEQRMTELLDQVQQQAQQMRQVMDTVPNGVALLDHQLQILMANTAAMAILHDICDLNTGDKVERIGDTSMTELLKPPENPGTWHEVQYQNRTYEILARAVNTLHHEHQAWVLAMRDVTAERMSQRYTMQQERLASVGQLAAGIAHDFNNIMAVIILYAGSLLMSKNLADDARERLQTISDQARTATSLIQQILDFSRRSALERRPMDLMPFLKEQRQLFQRTLPENIDVTMNHGRDDYIVSADPTSMQQVMMNLAVNARDAMPNGGTLTITLSVTHTPRLQTVTPSTDTLRQWVCIAVQDTGHGMPDEVMEHLFEPFHTTKAPGKGSGLGLAQVHGIVGQHEGEITVESLPDVGTTFRIYLPLHEVAQTQALEEEDDDLASGHGETILVVEDNAIMRASLVESLHLLNYKSLEAGNGHEALFILSRHAGEVDMVLSDVVMPSMGGVDLFHAIQEQQLDVPMALLTGHPLRSEMDGLLEQGLRAWMTKPPSLDALAKMLRKTLGDPDYV